MFLALCHCGKQYVPGQINKIMTIKTFSSCYLHNVQLHNCDCMGCANVSKSLLCVCVCIVMQCGFLAYS